MPLERELHSSPRTTMSRKQMFRYFLIKRFVDVSKFWTDAVLLPVAGLVMAYLVSTPEAVADPISRFELTPFIGYRIGGSIEDADTGESVDLNANGAYGLIVNIREQANTQYEFGWSHQDTSVDLLDLNGDPGKLELAIDFFQIGGTYLWEGNVARPFLVATIGAAHYRPRSGDGDADTFFAFTIGGGWKLWPTRRFGLRLEGRYYGTLMASDTSIFCSSAPDNSGCLIKTRGKLLSQWEITAGGAFRF